MGYWGKFVMAVSLAATVVVSETVPVSGARTEPFKLPEQASEVAQGVFFLGTAVIDGVMVDGYAFSTDHTVVRGRSANARPAKPGKGNGSGGGGTQDPAASCYSFISAGAKWRQAEPYVVGTDTLGVGASLAQAFPTWEEAVDEADFVGLRGSDVAELVADTVSPDGVNEVYSAAVDDPGVLGYTIVWSTRGRGRNPGEIIEADMVIDTGWTWGEGPDAFDLDTVVLHEAGHWVGLGHTNTTNDCGGQVMYPTVGTGEVRTELGAGDRAGILALYGS